MGYRGNDPTEDAGELTEERVIEPEDMLMPVYEWKCPKCSNRFEKIKPIDEFYEEEHCPECGALAMPWATVPAKAVIKEAIHTDSGIPMHIHNSLKNQTHELYDRNLTRQGKLIEPEDM